MRAFAVCSGLCRFSLHLQAACKPTPQPRGSRLGGFGPKTKELIAAGWVKVGTSASGSTLRSPSGRHLAGRLCICSSRRHPNDALSSLEVRTDAVPSTSNRSTKIRKIGSLSQASAKDQTVPCPLRRKRSSPLRNARLFRLSSGHGFSRAVTMSAKRATIALSYPQQAFAFLPRPNEHRIQSLAIHLVGTAQTKLAASFVSPVPEYRACCG
jgi:hypothetical protein